MDELPTVILTVTISLIILSVGVFAFFTVTIQTAENVDLSLTETFDVFNASQDKSVNLNYDPASINSVQFNNGSGYYNIPAAGYTLTDNTITVANAYMY